MKQYLITLVVLLCQAVVNGDSCGTTSFYEGCCTCQCCSGFGDCSQLSDVTYTASFEVISCFSSCSEFDCRSEFSDDCSSVYSSSCETPTPTPTPTPGPSGIMDPGEMIAIIFGTTMPAFFCICCCCLFFTIYKRSKMRSNVPRTHAFVPQKQQPAPVQYPGNRAQQPMQTQPQLQQQQQWNQSPPQDLNQAPVSMVDQPVPMFAPQPATNPATSGYAQPSSTISAPGSGVEQPQQYPPYQPPGQGQNSMETIQPFTFSQPGTTTASTSVSGTAPPMDNQSSIAVPPSMAPPAVGQYTTEYNTGYYSGTAPPPSSQAAPPPYTE